jgi:hypothetical protein
VPCPVTGSMRAAYKGGNNEFHLEIMVRGFTNRRAKVEFQTSSNGCVERGAAPELQLLPERHARGPAHAAAAHGQ